MNKSPRITLSNGTTIPQLGFGTLGVPPDRRPSRANTEKTAQIVGLALEVGYRHIDTAQMYGNERGVGEAIAASGIPREELYVTSKLGNGNHRPADVRRSFDETLEKLGIEQLDLFLMHWPLPTLHDGDYVSTWEAMCELVAGGALAHRWRLQLPARPSRPRDCGDGGCAGRQPDRGPPVLRQQGRSCGVNPTWHCSGGVESARAGKGAR